MKMNWHDIAEIVGGIITMVLFALLAWAFLVITPDQRSAECDYWADQLKKAQVAE